MSATSDSVVGSFLQANSVKPSNLSIQKGKMSCMDTLAWALRNLIAELFMPQGIWVMWVLLMLFLIKKHELIKKALIVFGLAMLWVTSTNFFAIQLTNLVGTYVIWPKPLNISDLRSNQSPSTLLPSKAASRDQKKSIGG